MRRDFFGALLFAFLSPGCMQDQPSPSAVQSPDSRAAVAPHQAQAVPPGCDLAAVPGQGKEYNLFANMAGAQRGCAAPSPVTYQKSDGHPAPSQQEELDRAACRSEGERAARAARGLQPGEYDIVKNMMAAQSGNAEKIEQSCMTQRGYKSVVN